jgi:hypothetical protein
VTGRAPAGVILAGVCIAAILGLVGEESAWTVHGEVTLTASSAGDGAPTITTSADGSCGGRGVLGDLAAGTTVAVYHGRNKVATTVLGQGRPGSDAARRRTCTLRFLIEGVPPGQPLNIEVARRGPAPLTGQPDALGMIHVALAFTG